MGPVILVSMCCTVRPPAFRRCLGTRCLHCAAQRPRCCSIEAAHMLCDCYPASSAINLLTSNIRYEAALKQLESRLQMSTTARRTNASPVHPPRPMVAASTTPSTQSAMTCSRAAQISACPAPRPRPMVAASTLLMTRRALVRATAFASDMLARCACDCRSAAVSAQYVCGVRKCVASSCHTCWPDISPARHTRSLCAEEKECFEGMCDLYAGKCMYTPADNNCKAGVCDKPNTCTCSDEGACSCALDASVAAFHRPCAMPRVAATVCTCRRCSSMLVGSICTAESACGCPSTHMRDLHAVARLAIAAPA